MYKVVGVKFPYTLKIVDYLPGREKVDVRDYVVVETPYGLEIGQVVYTEKEVEETTEIDRLKRKATQEDLDHMTDLEERARDLFGTFREKIESHRLKMRPVGVSYSLDEQKVIFYFTADGRVDFRELAKDLSRIVKKQAVLRQIGPRDQAKIVGGYGRCGLPVCCASFTIDSGSVSMDDAEKAYGMPKSAAKISGLCGRLMCCIKYEEEGEKRKKK